MTFYNPSKLKNDGINQSFLSCFYPGQLAGPRPDEDGFKRTQCQLSTVSTSFTGSSSLVFLLNPSGPNGLRIAQGYAVTHPSTGLQAIGWNHNTLDFDDDIDHDTVSFRDFRLLTFGMNFHVQNVALNANQFNGAIEAASFTGWPEVASVNPENMSRYDPKRFTIVPTLADGFQVAYVPSAKVPRRPTVCTLLTNTRTTSHHNGGGVTWASSIATGSLAIGPAAWQPVVTNDYFVKLTAADNYVAMGPGVYKIDFELSVSYGTSVSAPSNLTLVANYLAHDATLSPIYSKRLVATANVTDKSLSCSTSLVFYTPYPLEEIAVMVAGASGVGLPAVFSDFNVTKMDDGSDQAFAIVLLKDLDATATIACNAVATVEVTPANSIMRLVSPPMSLKDDYLDVLAMYEAGAAMNNFVMLPQTAFGKATRFASDYSSRAYNVGRASILGNFFKRLWAGFKKVGRPMVSTAVSAFAPELAPAVNAGLGALGFASQGEAKEEEDELMPVSIGRASMHSPSTKPPCVTQHKKTMCNGCAVSVSKLLNLKPSNSLSAVAMAAGVKLGTVESERAFWSKLETLMSEAKELDEETHESMVTNSVQSQGSSSSSSPSKARPAPAPQVGRCSMRRRKLAPQPVDEDEEKDEKVSETAYSAADDDIDDMDTEDLIVEQESSRVDAEEQQSKKDDDVDQPQVSRALTDLAKKLQEAALKVAGSEKKKLTEEMVIGTIQRNSSMAFSTPSVRTGHVSGAMFPYVVETEAKTFEPHPATLALTNQEVAGHRYRKVQLKTCDITVHVDAKFKDAGVDAVMDGIIFDYATKRSNLDGTFISVFSKHDVSENSWNLAMLAAIMDMPAKCFWSGGISIGQASFEVPSNTVVKAKMIVAMGGTLLAGIQPGPVPNSQNSGMMLAKRTTTLLLKSASLNSGYVCTLGDMVAAVRGLMLRAPKMTPEAHKRTVEKYVAVLPTLEGDRRKAAETLHSAYVKTQKKLAEEADPARKSLLTKKLTHMVVNMEQQVGNGPAEFEPVVLSTKGERAMVFENSAQRAKMVDLLTIKLSRLGISKEKAKTLQGRDPAEANFYYLASAMPNLIAIGHPGSITKIEQFLNYSKKKYPGLYELVAPHYVDVGDLRAKKEKKPVVGLESYRLYRDYYSKLKKSFSAGKGTVTREELAAYERAVKPLMGAQPDLSEANIAIAKKAYDELRAKRVATATQVVLPDNGEDVSLIE